MPPEIAGPLPRWLRITDAPAPTGSHVIDGRTCRTKAGLLAEFARALGFPAYFGHNWDALADCLRDTAYGGKPALDIAHAEELLADEPALLTTLLDILGTLADETEHHVTVAMYTRPARRELLLARIVGNLPRDGRCPPIAVQPPGR